MPRSKDNTDGPEEGRALTAREFFTALAEGYQLPLAPWDDEELPSTPAPETPTP